MKNVSDASEKFLKKIYEIFFKKKIIIYSLQSVSDASEICHLSSE